MKRIWIRIGAIAAGALFALSSGCQNELSSRPSNGASNRRSSSQAPAPTPTTLPTFTPAPAPTPDEDALPVIEQRVKQVGYNDFEITGIQAGKRLKVQFIPGKQDSPVAVEGQEFMPFYSKLGVFITVNSQTTATPMLNNGFTPGSTASKSPVIDFSSAIASQCQGQGDDCRKSITIKVGRPNYDYWCLNHAVYCPWTHVHTTHPWNGTLLIETDDTVSISTVGAGSN